MPIDATFLDTLVVSLAAIWPVTDPNADRIAAARAAIAAHEPRDITEAILAVQMLTAQFLSMDAARRSMQPDLDDAEVIRQRNSAFAANRTFHTSLRAFDKRRTPAEKKSPRVAAAKPPPVPKPSEPRKEFVLLAEPELTYTPRDKHGAPIPLHRWQDMTGSQRKAVYGDPADKELQAIAIAEEEAMIAAENARLAAETAEPQLSSSLSQ